MVVKMRFADESHPFIDSFHSAALHCGVGDPEAKHQCRLRMDGRPDDAYQKARLQLAKEADAAALLVTPDVREAYQRDCMAVVRGAVEKH